VWPGGLPSPIVSGNNYQPAGDNVLRSPFTGGIKMRRRSSAALEVVRFSLVLTRAQVQVLDSFVIQTLKDVLPFDWVEFRDPDLGTAIYRFRGRPSYQPVQVNRVWQADIELDLLTPFTGSFNLSSAAGLLSTGEDETILS